MGKQKVAASVYNRKTQTILEEEEEEDSAMQHECIRGLSSHFYLSKHVDEEIT